MTRLEDCEFSLTEESSHEDWRDRKAWSRGTKASKVAREKRLTSFARFSRDKEGSGEKTWVLVGACITSVFGQKVFHVDEDFLLRYCNGEGDGRGGGWIIRQRKRSSKPLTIDKGNWFLFENCVTKNASRFLSLRRGAKNKAIKIKEQRCRIQI